MCAEVEYIIYRKESNKNKYKVGKEIGNQPYFIHP